MRSAADPSAGLRTGTVLGTGRGWAPSGQTQVTCEGILARKLLNSKGRNGGGPEKWPVRTSPARVESCRSHQRGVVGAGLLSVAVGQADPRPGLGRLWDAVVPVALGPSPGDQQVTVPEHEHARCVASLGTQQEPPRLA